MTLPKFVTVIVNDLAAQGGLSALFCNFYHVQVQHKFNLKQNSTSLVDITGFYIYFGIVWSDVTF